MGTYTNEIIEILKEEAKYTDETAAIILPILHEIIYVKNCNHRDLLCGKLLVEAKIFNQFNK